MTTVLIMMEHFGNAYPPTWALALIFVEESNMFRGQSFNIVLICFFIVLICLKRNNDYGENTNRIFKSFNVFRISNINFLKVILISIIAIIF